MGRERKWHLRKGFPEMVPGTAIAVAGALLAYVFWEFATEQAIIHAAQYESLNIAKESNTPETVMETLRTVNPNAGYNESPDSTFPPGPLRFLLNTLFLASVYTSYRGAKHALLKRNPNYYSSW